MLRFGLCCIFLAEPIRFRRTTARYLDTGAGSVTAGRFLSEVDVDLSRSAIVLGWTVAEQLFPGVRPAEMLGKRVNANGFPFTIVGVMAKRGQMLGMDMDNNALVPYSTFLREAGSRRSVNIAVAADPEHLEALEDQLVGILRRVRQVRPDKPDDFAINRQEQALRIYRQLTGALYGVALGVGLITLVVGGIGIMNIMLVSASGSMSRGTAMSMKNIGRFFRIRMTASTSSRFRMK